MYPADLKYTKDHEWMRVAGDRGTVGITDYAQQQLGDVVYVELPEVGATLKQGESFGTIESVKAVSELFAPVSGEVVEVNAALKDQPEAVNTDPHDSWMIVRQARQPGRSRRAARRRRVRRTRRSRRARTTIRPCPTRSQRRHIGPRAADVATRCSRSIGAPSLDALIDEAIPAGIRLHAAARPAAGRDASTTYLRAAARRSRAKNQRVPQSYIGLGYYDRITPSVILRNVLENPGWYTPYTPYQAEIAQGRLEVAAQLPDDGARPDGDGGRRRRRCSTRRRRPPRR